jgi:hypothetical protein
MPFVEVIHVADEDLPPSRVAAFAEAIREIFGAVTQTRPEQLRMVVRAVPPQATMQVLDMVEEDDV